MIGPSGVGKSVISEWVTEDLKFLHLDIDQHHGFHVNHLNKEWHQYSYHLDPNPLALVLQNRIVEVGCSGAVLSFPSTRIFTREQIDIARSVGIVTVLLWGPEKLCKKAAIERPNMPVLEESYNRSNQAAFSTYSSPVYDDVRIEAFLPDGHRSSHEEIVGIILRLISS